MNNLPRRTNDASRPASTLNVLAGIWLIISAWVLGYSGVSAAMGDMLIVGIVVLILAAIRLGTPGAVGLSWINVLLGIWLIISPFVLGFTAASAAMSNAIILGILVVLFGLWAALASQTPRRRHAERLPAVARCAMIVGLGKGRLQFRGRGAPSCSAA
ncbi:MAG TPA: SPW repeat protein [Gemmataceae bacterium]|nr:SPW repeat protein [Gemmataceae bacterium]